ncbi:lytic transglycosylase domain-containing protein [Terrarubrum flagellatum]|uniref:lytic transglycosylase domain-containing protein n=1 Tax=Terrirubrum flagellatum TaxID=2895980 RepID=UPI0031455C54
MSFLSLFTTPATPEPAPTTGSGLADAVRQGADKSGVSFDYLMRTATRESALDPNAKAPTSSATGLYQFIEQTWLASIKADGAKYGLQGYADAITTGSNGRLTVADPAMRSQILALRKDPHISSALAGELAQRNGASLSDTLGRQASDGELYVAHVLGARGAASLLARASATPDLKAATYFPDEAAANRGLFYTPSGQPRTLAQLRQKLMDGFDAQTAVAVVPTAASSSASAASGAWLSFFPQAASASDSGRPLDGLFQTEGVRGPLTPSVKRIWTASADASSGAGSYFPTGSGGALNAPARAAPSPESKSESPTTPAAVSNRKKRGVGKPLDLQSLMKPIAA